MLLHVVAYILVRKSNNHSISTCFFTFVLIVSPTTPTPLKSNNFDLCTMLLHVVAYILVRKSNNHSILTCFFTLVLIVSPTTPTPLKSNNFDLCLAPSSKSCSPRDNELIIFVSGSRCSERHFQFTRGKDGLLRHACSGKLVCPENGGTHNGAKIVVSRTCKVADSKFIRTVGKSKEMHITS